MSSPDRAEDLRNKICAEIGCTGRYFDETIKMLAEDCWKPGGDADRDVVVEALAQLGTTWFEFLREASRRPDEHKHLVDYTKGGSVFDEG